ncbi:hypothetical protein K470DRAFT_229696 [Piedraia hortae CBS 480.64]|uniref:25S rRNA adenine-N(1) methyltransferase n=1 Tax=Piedraia hortae CBS 480.64 TaxID=1314780 RepID=A0A6A7C4V7_9PEZI|nr:hypothetical protein K470DRAFT_229696 [Piedraia hortae CBS 480.64]
MLKSTKRKPLSAGRPPLLTSNPRALTQKSSRHLIRTHHTLAKKLSFAERNNNTREVVLLRTKLADLGGIESYQAASSQGQAVDRGGDSSRILIEWLFKNENHVPQTNTPLSPSRSEARPPLNIKESGQNPRMLEIGSLSTNNACSRSGKFEMTRIDLRPPVPGIEKADFMLLPVPETPYDILSLSLVLNFVPEPGQRGEMLRRVSRFLRRGWEGNVDASRSRDASGAPSNGLLFLVLPAPCVLNSRYLTEERLEEIMRSLGFALRERKVGKLVYYLWELVGPGDGRVWLKEVLREGGGRNNFAVVLR